MAKVWCNENDCVYNRKCRCKAREVMVYEGDCISLRYDKPDPGRVSRDPEDVRKDREANRVGKKIVADLMERMKKNDEGAVQSK